MTPDKARGTNTLVTQCVSFTRAAFANAACDDLLARLDPLITASGLRHIALGRTEWGFGVDEYLKADEALPAKGTLHLTAYLRGADSPPAMHIWLSLYRQTGEGRLVLWEDSGLGSGDKDTIAKGLSQGLATKLKPVLDTLGQMKDR